MTQSYPIEVFWSDEDQIWIANAPDLTFCTGHGATPQSAVEEVETAVEAWLNVARKNVLDIPEPSRKSIRA